MPRPSLRLLLVSCLCFVLWAAPALAQYPRLSNGNLLRDPPNTAVPGDYFFRKGQEAFERKDYAHAAAMWRVAASWAKKTAQFNLGLMYFKGVGVPADHAEGMAWLALAAERGDAPFVDAREWAYAAMTPEEFEHANARWRELKVTFGDKVALARANFRYRLVVDNPTGSRVGSNSGLIQTLLGEDAETYYRRLREQGGPYGHGPYPEVKVGDLIPLEPQQH